MARIRELDNFNRLRRLINDNENEDNNGCHYIQTNDLKLPSSTQISVDSLKFHNKNGDIIVLSPEELKETINEFIENEISLYADDTIVQYRKKTEHLIEKRLDNFQLSLKQHVDEKINKISENIIEQILSRVVDEKVNKMVEDKLNKIKKLL